MEIVGSKSGWQLSLETSARKLAKVIMMQGCEVGQITSTKIQTLMSKSKRPSVTTPAPAANQINDDDDHDDDDNHDDHDGYLAQDPR